MSANLLSRNLILAATVVLLSMVLSACGGDAAIDATAPTLVPTYTPSSVGAAAESASAPAAAPTIVPTAASTATTAPTPTTAPTATAEPAATVAPSATAEPTATTEPTATAEPTVVAEPTAVAEPTVVAEPTATAEPTVVAEPTTTDTVTMTLPMTGAVSSVGMPAELAAALASADPVHGQELTVANGCIACHALGEGQQLVGPSWYGVGATAATRVPGQSAEEYLYHSIVAPNDYLVEGYIAGLMPAIYGDTLATDDLADIIGYLLSLQ